jgi:hypothetical protein
MYKGTQAGDCCHTRPCQPSLLLLSNRKRRAHRSCTFWQHACRQYWPALSSMHALSTGQRYAGGGYCDDCALTLRLYSASFWVNRMNASDCAGLCGLGVSSSSCMASVCLWVGVGWSGQGQHCMRGCGW